MRNILIILLTVVIVIAGAFLPDLLLKRNSEPEIRMGYQQVTITSQSSSDYAWRMERIAEHYYGEGEHLLTTYISEEEGTEAGSELHTQFVSELNRLIAMGAVPSDVGQVLIDSLDYRIRSYYLFDSESVSGFRIAEFVAAASNWNITMCLDVESGKLAKVQYGGSKLVPGGSGMPIGSSSWYDMLRSYAEYLGLNATALSSAPAEPDQTARRYYETCTADRLAANLHSSRSWLELRTLKETYRVTLTVYNGGK